MFLAEFSQNTYGMTGEFRHLQIKQPAWNILEPNGEQLDQDLG
jgi:hypothetical protein